MSEPYLMQNNRKVNNKKLHIKKINVKENYVEIILEHWNFKWINRLGILYEKKVHFEFGYNNFENYIDEFRKKWEDKLFIFELIIPLSFFEKHNLDEFCYFRQDKYETELLFKKEEKQNGI